MQGKVFGELTNAVVEEISKLWKQKNEESAR